MFYDSDHDIFVLRDDRDHEEPHGDPRSPEEPKDKNRCLSPSETIPWHHMSLPRLPRRNLDGGKLSKRVTFGYAREKVIDTKTTTTTMMKTMERDKTLLKQTANVGEADEEDTKEDKDQDSVPRRNQNTTETIRHDRDEENVDQTKHSHGALIPSRTSRE